MSETLCECLHPVSEHQTGTGPWTGFCAEIDCKCEDPVFGAVTVFDVAKARGIKPAPGESGVFRGDEFVRVGLPFFGGCQRCAASCGPSQMCPGRNGYVFCQDCVGDQGFATVESFEQWSKHDEAYGDDHGEDCPFCEAS